MNFDLYTDIATLTTSQLASLQRIVDIGVDCICSDVYESEINGESLACIDIGFGFLNILFYDDEIKYKFVPNSTLETKLVETLTNHVDPLVKRIEGTLHDKILTTKKELV